MIRCGSSKKGARVASPSATVLNFVGLEIPALPGPVGGGRCLRLDADHPSRPAHPLGGDAGTGHTASASDRNDEDVRLGLLLENLERLGCDACNQVRLVTGVDVAVPVLPGQLLTVLAGLVEVAALGHDLGAEGFDRRNLQRVCADGDANHRPDAEQLGREGDRLTVVPRGGRDEAVQPLVLRELRTRFTPPRTLKAPTGWWFSCLTQTSAPASSHRSGQR